MTADVVGLEDLKNYHPNVSPMNQLKNLSPFYTFRLVCQILYRPVYKTRTSTGIIPRHNLIIPKSRLFTQPLRINKLSSK